MNLDKLFLMSLSMLPLMLQAQDVTHNQVHQAQQSIQSTIQGTLNGAIQAPRFIQNRAPSLVFPGSLESSFSINPWSMKRAKPRAAQQQGYNSAPKGNPWAPIGDTQNIPFDKSNTTGMLNNPYTDSQPIRQRPRYSSNNFMASPFGVMQQPFSAFNGGYNNQSYDGSNGSFSTPFGNSFMPNQFWQNTNGNNGSFPFMPW